MRTHTLKAAGLWLLLIFVPVTALSDDWDDFVVWALEQCDTDDDGIDDMLEQLEALHHDRINVNDCSAADLEQVTFLTAGQIDDIVYYVGRVGRVQTLAELVYIESLDVETRRWLPLFIYAGEQAVPKRRVGLGIGRHELLTRIDLPLYRRAGYTVGNEQRRYQGSRMAHNLKYGYTQPLARDGAKIRLGLALDKDEGEPVGRPFAAGYDFVGGNVAVSGVGCLRSVVVGDYKASFGEGLLINQQYMMGKSLSAGSGIKAKNSTAETNFMRGAAATVALGRRLTATTFVSYTLLDATVGSDGQALGLSSVSTHRNATEMGRRHNTAETLYGAHVEWRDSTWWIGATAFDSHYHLPFERGEEAYRRFYPEGDRFWGASADYGVRLRRFTLRGETSTDGHGVATLNRLVYRHSARLQAQLAHRWYGQRYHSFHARSLAEWGVQNEQGVFLAVDAEPARWLRFVINADLFRSSHPRYQISHATNGEHLRLRADYRINNRHALSASASYKHREQYDIMHTAQRYQCGWTCTMPRLTTHLLAQVSHYSDAKGLRSMGCAVQARAAWQPSEALRVAASAAWFASDDYNSRLYLAEPALRGAPAYTMLHGRGLRLASTVRVQLARGMKLTLRYAFTRRFDAATIGTDLQAIRVPWQNDLSLQLSLRL